MATSLKHRSKSDRQRLTWAHRETCPGCGKAFRTDSGYAYHLAWSAECNSAYDAVQAGQQAPADTRKAPKRKQRRGSEAQRQWMRSINPNRATGNYSGQGA